MSWLFKTKKTSCKWCTIYACAMQHRYDVMRLYPAPSMNQWQQVAWSPGLPRFLVFGFSIIHGSGRTTKKGWAYSSREWRSQGLFPSGGGGKAISLAEVENIAALHLLILGGGWRHAPPDDFSCSEAHSGAFWSIQRSTRSFLRRGSSSKSSLLAELLEHWKPSPLLKIYTIGLIIYTRRKQTSSVSRPWCAARSVAIKWK